MAQPWNVLDWPTQSPDLSPTEHVSLSRDQTEEKKQASSFEDSSYKVTHNCAVELI